MNDSFYKSVVEHSPVGYAYHKIICDEAGNPCDYEFIEINSAFEKLTGLFSRNDRKKNTPRCCQELLMMNLTGLHFMER